MMQIVGAALGGLGSEAPGAPLRTGLPARRATRRSASRSFRSSASAWGSRSPAPAAGAKGAMGMGTGDAAGPGAGGNAVDDTGSEKELAFYKSFATLHGNSTRLLKTAVECGKISEPIGKVTEAIAGVRDAGITRSDYPVTKIDKDAASLESASRALAAAAPGVETAPRRPQGSRGAHGPHGAQERRSRCEKEIWKAWAAGLTPKDRDLLDLDGIENYLKRIGIWAELGIDIGELVLRRRGGPRHRVGAGPGLDPRAPRRGRGVHPAQLRREHGEDRRAAGAARTCPRASTRGARSRPGRSRPPWWGRRRPGTSTRA